MGSALIIAFCVLLLFAYVFDLTASKTRVPAVILLLLLGWAVRQAADALNIALPDFAPLLPVLGTIGLILIVLEGALELNLTTENLTVIRKSFVLSLLPVIALSATITLAIHFITGASFRLSLLNAIPLSVISSSVAISSARTLKPEAREYVVYESSLSDIIGVLFFNFLLYNTSYGINSIGMFLVQLLIIAVVSFVASILLAFLLARIDHQVKFIPIILLVILIYFISKNYHLPALLFILAFGLFIGNLQQIKDLRWLKFDRERLESTVERFTELTIEATFLVRALFFILFGFLINNSVLLNVTSLAWAVGIAAAIYLIRALQLRLLNIPQYPLLFFAPRGLITILLFLSIPMAERISPVNQSLIIQLILITAFVMMAGVFRRSDPSLK